MGGGNCAQTMAADLALAGSEVSLCDLPKFRKNIEPLMKSGSLTKVGLGRKGTTKLERVTTDVGEAIRGTDVIMIAVPAFGHMPFYEAIANKIEDNQIVVSTPGNWGALKLFNLLKKQGIHKNIKIAETSTCMHICRASENWLGPGTVRIVMERTKVQIAAIPAKDTDVVLNRLKPVYPILIPAINVIETSLNNSNIVYHGPVVLMNTGWIEHTEGEFMIYRDGLTPSIGRCIDALCEERDAILKALNILPQPRPESTYEETINSQWVHDPCEVGPPSLRHRYITEDIPHGLVPLADLGNRLGVETPLSDSMITLASKANQIDYWTEGTTLEKLGLAGLKPEEIRNSPLFSN